MSRAEGDGNRRHYHVVRGAAAEHQPLAAEAPRVGRDCQAG